MARPSDRTHRGLDRGVKPLPVILAHVISWVLVAVVLVFAFSDGPLTAMPSPEPLLVFALFGAAVGALTGLLHVGVRVVRS